ncbi:polymorphic toxin-type HINT domain-containing protein [Anaerohalosphaera lusitana]|uniref:polymorphic toxin-type HINT domain-containing protein n=1 Tax=Anaerohalosphaera lusitana TaxID=1936003 RepID=UPI0011BA805F
MELCEVVRCYERQTDAIYVLTVGDEVIETTAEQPFFVKGRGWYKAGELKAGDLLCDVAGRAVTLDKIDKMLSKPRPPFTISK